MADIISSTSAAPAQFAPHFINTTSTIDNTATSIQLDKRSKNSQVNRHSEHDNLASGIKGQSYSRRLQLNPAAQGFVPQSKSADNLDLHSNRSKGARSRHNSTNACKPSARIDDDQGDVKIIICNPLAHANVKTTGMAKASIAHGILQSRNDD
ncbi:hypothetical protein BC939DRAFT_99840 [Gamsiella multidivaricata]|uniref:uncharacterized protein n=1 Tax=Gamsiella multidivaricata TaxID=101098 RepID=UPI00221F0902|nr:uncharacterized protein BC939DRAFT_99840 [Gamsiella multidivaricata]KAI7832274.1 hypothetical protein BC939DRAFT_99840 [Gamsiella multidivaricata]